MHSIRQSCRIALQRPDTFCLAVNGSRRAFSRSSAWQRGALPVFLEPSNPGLSTLLSTLNSKVLLPCHLTSEQQKLVYKVENIPKLESEPIEITLGDVTLPLEHIDRNKDQPDRWRQFRSVVAKSETREDWENVIRMMEGYENAGISLKRNIQELVVRKLGDAGCHHLILKALQRVSQTGLRLNNLNVVREVSRAIHDKAALADWDKEELRKALKMAEQVVELMEDKEHLKKETASEDLRARPFVVAVPAELAARLSLAHDGDHERVTKYINRLLSVLQQHNFLADDLKHLDDLIAEQHYFKPNQQARALTSLSLKLFTLIPVWNALKTARLTQGNKMPEAKEAAILEKALRERLHKGVNALEKLRLRDGSEIASKKGYAAYIADAVKRCNGDDV